MLLNINNEIPLTTLPASEKKEKKKRCTL